MSEGRRTVIKRIVGEVIEAMWAYGEPGDWYDHATFKVPKALRKAMQSAVGKAMPALAQVTPAPGQPGLTDGPATMKVTSAYTPTEADQVAYRDLKASNRQLQERVNYLERNAQLLAKAREAEERKWQHYVYTKPSPNWEVEATSPLAAEMLELLRAIVAEQEMERMRMGLRSTFPQTVVGEATWDKARAQVVERRRVAEKNIAVAFALKRDAVLTYIDPGV